MDQTDEFDEFDEFDDERLPAEEQPVVPGPGRGRLPDDPEVPEADALDQSIEVPLDDEVDEPA